MKAWLISAKKINQGYEIYGAVGDEDKPKISK